MIATIWYSIEYNVDVDVLGRYIFLLIKFNNLLLRLFHTFGGKQIVSKCLQIPLLLPPLVMPMVSIPLTNSYLDDPNPKASAVHHVHQIAEDKG